MRLSVTREGKRFLLAITVVAFAAFNTANNLMYLILALMLSSLIISLTLPYIMLRGLKFSFSVQEPLFANRESVFTVTVKNLKRKVTSYSFRVIVPELLDDGLYIERIEPGDSLEFAERIRFRRRGVYRLGQTRVSSSFPFIFFTLRMKATEDTASQKSVVIYPEIYDLKKEVDEFVYSLITEASSMIRTESEEFQSIREYRYGDSWRSIHWKATARTGQLMVKECYEGTTEQVTVVLDSMRYPSSELFEKAISFTASLTSELIGRNYSVRFVTCHKSIPYGSGTEHLYKILDHLAMIEEGTDIGCPFDESLDGMIVMVLSSRASSLRRYTSSALRVYYATDL